LNAQGFAVKLAVEIGKVTDSPAQRNAAALAEKQKAAENLIQSDPLVQDMIQNFGAKIVPGTIRLIS
jgi:DNA polymerase-3 subunit gamma/tau